MPRSYQVQRLRSQLGACREQVCMLEQKIAHQDSARALDAKAQAVAERLLLERVAAAEARCRSAEQRALAAELRLLPHAEAEQRAGLAKVEGDGWDALFPEKTEGVHRTDILAAEQAAWDAWAAEQAANRKAIKRQRESRRKSRQKQRKGKRGGGKSVSLDDSGVESSDEFATAHSVITTASDPESTIAPSSMSSSEALFVDHICFWIAAFVPHSWAPVCSKAARTVLKVINIYVGGWKVVGSPIAAIQSMGSDYLPDLELLGPGIGLFYHSILRVRELRKKVFNLQRANRSSAPPRWISRWLLHMDRQCNMYEEMRLEHKELYIAARGMIIDYADVRKTLGEVLESFDQRKLAEEGEEADDSGERGSSP
eukprot:TRINITY_DN15114_c0_g2_i1.p1 TRINITY_DN15114_c0_g2~~TRINITY_DN15114_c0_g2_i1.p1  ORF type:complete len:370 (+),score=86.29 TRINITY_DN15114_c0_g2_i1:91-1200(+)